MGRSLPDGPRLPSGWRCQASWPTVAHLSRGSARSRHAHRVLRHDRHLRRMRGEYSRRRDALVGALAEHAPHVALTGLAAGFHAVAHLPDGADEEAVVAQARERRVGLYGMARYRSIQGAHSAQLVLGFGNTGARAIEELDRGSSARCSERAPPEARSRGRRRPLSRGTGLVPA